MEIEQKSDSAKPRKPGTFAPGHRFHRPKGAAAIITRELKAGIVDAAKAHGSDGNGTDGLRGYLRMCAKKHPRQFLQLIRKVMPSKLGPEAAQSIDAMLASPPPPPAQPLTAMDIYRRATLQPPKRTLRPP